MALQMRQSPRRTLEGHPARKTTLRPETSDVLLVGVLGGVVLEQECQDVASFKDVFIIHRSIHFSRIDHETIECKWISNDWLSGTKGLKSKPIKLVLFNNKASMDVPMQEVCTIW